MKARLQFTSGGTFNFPNKVLCMPAIVFGDKDREMWSFVFEAREQIGTCEYIGEAYWLCEMYAKGFKPGTQFDVVGHPGMYDKITRNIGRVATGEFLEETTP